MDALLGGTSTGPQKVVPEPDDQWLQDVDEEDSKDEKGPPVNDQLAKMADRRFRKATAIPKVKDLQEKYLIPGNCNDVTIPKVNGEVWQKVVQQDSRALKSQYFKLSSIQRALVGATGGLLHIMKALSGAIANQGLSQWTLNSCSKQALTAYPCWDMPIMKCH